MSVGRFWRGLSALALGLALTCAPALAQTNPGSTQNVAPAVGAGAVASVEARRQVLFTRMLADPANLDIAFEYAALSQQVGDLEAAVSTLERMLIFAPGLPRLQFELGVLYFRLGAYETANTYFEAVAAAPDVPADIQAQVAAYLDAAATRSAGAFARSKVTVGLRGQTNANAGPANPIITINGFDFILAPSAMSQPDVNAFAAASFDGSVDLESQGDRFDFSLDAYGSIYQNLTVLNAGIIELEAGPTFNLQRINIDNTTFGIYVITGGAMLSGDLYLATIGAGSKIDFVLDARTRVKLVGEAVYERYFDSALRPTASLRTGMHYSAEAGIDHRLTGNVTLFASLKADRRVAATAFYTNWQLGAEAGAVIDFAAPIEAMKGNGNWSIGLSAGVRHLVADVPDPVFSATAPEQTNTAFIQGSLKVPLGNAVTFETSAAWSTSFSNYALANHQNVSVIGALSKTF